MNHPTILRPAFALSLALLGCGALDVTTLRIAGTDYLFVGNSTAAPDPSFSPARSQ